MSTLFLWPSGETQTSVTYGGTRRSTWQLPMVTSTAFSTWCLLVPTYGAWTMTTTHLWTWLPRRITWIVYATWIPSLPSRQALIPSWSASWRIGRFVMLNGESKNAWRCRRSTTNVWRESFTRKFLRHLHQMSWVSPATRAALLATSCST